ncbi:MULTISPECIES: DUF6722 family protein [Capnocytophaga]|jgi:probable cyclin-dependent serine/threonine-protein kinase DDB_G0292550|uniref:DUF6722 family protein n=1 Tax=Capnocytophaga TaxID=1016 RepID=UPI0002A19DEA|nr:MULTISPECIES: DUF6722 family protein [Capnocytophaga]EKY10235.1 hypothetical protein HMPREF9075_01161 [Capnocytophaga sp. oral taxon 332 str. F0381]
MKKRISEFLLDVSKYIFVGLFVAPLFNSNAAANYWWVTLVASIALLLGLWLSNAQKGNNNTNKNNNNANRNKKNNNYRNNNNKKNGNNAAPNSNNNTAANKVANN